MRTCAAPMSCSASGTGIVAVIYAAACSLMSSSGAHSCGVNGMVTVAAAPDGRWLANSGDDREVRIWSRSPGKFEP